MLHVYCIYVLKSTLGNYYDYLDILCICARNHVETLCRQLNCISQPKAQEEPEQSLTFIGRLSIPLVQA
jgi:hypothetical protein